MKFCFSGHESFPCKALWLKKGYDFINNKNDFNSPDAVVELGVGKNMVSSIRFWMRAFGMCKDDKNTELASYLFDSRNGKDPYMEDLGTIWLLHFLLSSTGEATLYNWLFVNFQKERRIFDRQNVVAFVLRLLIENNKTSLFNENTVKTDIGVLLQNYVQPIKPKELDDYGSLLMDLDLIRTSDGKLYQFNNEGKRQVPWQIFLFAIITSKGDDNTVSYDLLQRIGLTFCMNDMEVIKKCMDIQNNCPKVVRYSDTAGVKQMQFIKKITIIDSLNLYYDKKE